MVYILVNQLTKSLFGGDNPVFVVFNGVDDIVIGYASLYHIILLLHFSAFSTVYHIIQPFKTICLEYFYPKPISHN